MKICKECPYKRTSAPGYLGEVSYNPEEFLKQDYHPCHLSIDWDNKDYSKSRICQGSLQFMKNTCKLPINEDIRKQLKEITVNSSEIFGRRLEFIEHHSEK